MRRACAAVASGTGERPLAWSIDALSSAAAQPIERAVESAIDFRLFGHALCQLRLDAQALATGHPASPELGPQLLNVIVTRHRPLLSFEDYGAHDAGSGRVRDAEGAASAGRGEADFVERRS